MITMFMLVRRLGNNQRLSGLMQYLAQDGVTRAPNNISMCANFQCNSINTQHDNLNDCMFNNCYSLLLTPKGPFSWPT